MGVRVRGSTGPSALPIVGGLFLAIGLVAVLAAGGLALAEHWSGRDLKSDGIVVGFVPADRVALPRIEFAPQSGAPVQFVSQTTRSVLKIGDHVPVAYASAHMTDARIDGPAGRWFLAVLAGSLGGGFVVIGLGLATLGMATKRRSAQNADS